MTELDTTLEAENAELSEESEVLDAATVVIDAVDESETETTEETADTVTEEAYEPTDTQVELAKQLGLSDDEIADMTEAEAIAYDKVARLDSRRQQRKGKKQEEVVDTTTTPDSAESSTTDEFFTDDDWYTEDGRKKINDLHKDLKSRNQSTETNEQAQLKLTADQVFDSLDPEIFAEFSPGESALIESGSDAESKRTQALQMAKTIQATAGGLGHEMTLEKAIQSALSVVAEAETQEAALKIANKGRKTRGKQRISTPSSTNVAHKVTHDTPEKQAVADIISELGPS